MAIDDRTALDASRRQAINESVDSLPPWQQHQIHLQRQLLAEIRSLRTIVLVWFVVVPIVIGFLLLAVNA